MSQDIIESQEFQLACNNKQYKLVVINKELDIAFQLDENSATKAQKTLSFENFAKLSPKYLADFQSLQDIYDELTEQILAEKAVLKDTGCFTLVITAKVKVDPIRIEMIKLDTPIQTKSPQEKVIPKEKEPDMKQEKIPANSIQEPIWLQSLYDKLDQLLFKVSFLTERVNVIDGKVNKIVGDEGDTRMRNEVGLLNPQTASIPLLTKEETQMICKTVFKINVELKLLYNPTQGEDTSSILSQHICDKAPLFILIQTRDGCRFGGYTSVGFDKVTNNQGELRLFLLL